MADTYMVNEKGQLFRKGEQIGVVEDNDLVLKPEAKRYVAAVTRWWNARDEEPEEAPKAEITKKLTLKEQDEADIRGVAKEAQDEARAFKEDWRDDLEFAKKKGIESPPKRNPQFGDKTPAYVEWLYKHRQDKFQRKYVHKGKGKIPVFRKNPDTGVDEFTGYEDAEFTLRKTHMTEKAEHNSELDDSMDWDA